MTGKSLNQIASKRLLQVSKPVLLRELDVSRPPTAEQVSEKAVHLGAPVVHAYFIQDRLCQISMVSVFFSTL